MKQIAKQVLTVLSIFFLLFGIFPNPILARNYGEAGYGEGTYNVGETPAVTGTTSTPGAPGCGDPAPGAKAPWLYGAIAQNSTSILLYFTDADDPVDHYVLEFGTKSGDYPWGATNVGKKGTRTVLVQSLQPNTTYYFRIRGGNGCATGNWSNEISAKTKGVVTLKSLDIIESELEPVASPSVEEKPASTCKTYTVQSGDSLSIIASRELGDGSKYTDIIDQNKDKYPPLSTSNSLRVGWELKLNCDGEDPEQKSTEPQEAEGATQEGYTVNIEVTDKAQNPVKGAKVTIHSTVQEATTNEKGIARFENVEPGDHRVLVAYNGYKGEQSINLTGDVKEFNLNITVELKNVLTSPLVLAIIGGLSLVILILVFFLLKSRFRK